MTLVRLRSAIRWEAVLIAVLGTVVGIGLGSLVVSWALVTSLGSFRGSPASRSRSRAARGRRPGRRRARPRPRLPSVRPAGVASLHILDAIAVD